MQRRILAVAAVLPLLAGCRDGPTTPIVPLEDGVAPTHLVDRTDALSVLRDLFDDPFMHELIETASARSLGRGFDDVAVSAARGDILAASRALTAARHTLTSAVSGDAEDEDHDVAILRDVVELVLSDAERILQPVRLERDEGNDQQSPNQKTGVLNNDTL